MPELKRLPRCPEDCPPELWAEICKVLQAPSGFFATHPGVLEDLKQMWWGESPRKPPQVATGTVTSQEPDRDPLTGTLRLTAARVSSEESPLLLRVRADLLAAADHLETNNDRNAVANLHEAVAILLDTFLAFTERSRMPRYGS